MRGGDKLLETINNVPILAHTAMTALAAGLGPVHIGLRPGAKARRKTLESLDVTLVEVPDADEGMAATLRAGATAAIHAIIANAESDHEHSGMMILMPDMPEISQADLKKLDAAFYDSGGACVRAATEEGEFGHPTVIPLHVLRDFEMLKGDRGAAEMFQTERVRTVPLQGNRARLDLDTPEDWAAWRAKTNTPC